MARTFEDYCPVCAICGERITDEEYRRIGSEYFHDDCIETGSVDTYVENRRQEEEIYGDEGITC